MSIQQERISYRETFRLHWRGFKIWYQQMPEMIWAKAVSAVVGALLPYANIYFAARILNVLTGSQADQTVWKWVLAALAVNGIGGILLAVLNRFKEMTSNWTLLFLEDKTVMRKKTQTMDFTVFEDQKVLDLRSKVAQNMQWGGRGFFQIQRYFERMVMAVMQILGAVVLTVQLFAMPVPENAGRWVIMNHPLVVLALLVVLAGLTVLAPVFQTRSNDYWNREDEDSRLGNRIFGFYGYAINAPDRALDMRIYEQYKVCRHYLEHGVTFGPDSQMGRFARGPMGLYGALGTVVSVMFTGAVYVFVCLKAWAGAFGIGSATQYISSITALSQGVSCLLETIGDMHGNTSYLRLTFAYLDTPNVMYQGSLTTEKRNDKDYEVEFRDVSFRYPGSETYALRHVNMKFRVGQRLAVVGENGSGKTTFIKLLCRLYDPTEGVILLNGIDIRKYKYQDYMSIFSTVFQDFELLALPLGENVAASSVYDRERVLDCLEKAGFGERLLTMEKGLDSYLYREFDEKGVQLSGGEAQKIALARALYKDAAFIILDEPTAALDPIAEYEVYTRFNDIVGDKTAIYISHRLASCRFCDDIAVFDQGSVIQQGTHETLLADIQGKYHALWQAQAQYYQQS